MKKKRHLRRNHVPPRSRRDVPQTGEFLEVRTAPGSLLPLPGFAAGMVAAAGSDLRSASALHRPQLPQAASTESWLAAQNSSESPVSYSSSRRYGQSSNDHSNGKEPRHSANVHPIHGQSSSQFSSQIDVAAHLKINLNPLAGVDADAPYAGAASLGTTSSSSPSTKSGGGASARAGLAEPAGGDSANGVYANIGDFRKPSSSSGGGG